MNNSTGSRYTETEEAFVRAGARLGSTAEEIAARLPGRSVASVQVKAHNLGLSLAKGVGLHRQLKPNSNEPVNKVPQIAASGQFGARFKPGDELNRYNAIIARAGQSSEINTLTDAIKAALDALGREMDHHQ